jgi:hypothetical protein
MAAAPESSCRSFRAQLAALLVLLGAIANVACGLAGPASLDSAQMQQRVAAALREPETLARTAALVALMQQLDASNVAGAATAYDATLSVVRSEDLQLFLHAWAAFDPAAALDHTQAWPMLAKREIGAGQVVYYWAWHEGAVDAKFSVESLSEPSVRRIAKAQLVKGWARSSDTQGVTEYVASLAQGDLRDRYAAHVVAAIMATSGVDGVIRWAEGLPDDAHDRFKRTAFRKALRHVTARDPERGARWYEQHAGAAYADLGMPIVATEWIEHDPQAAFAWLLANPTSAQRDVALRTSMSRWLALDPVAAAEWMQNGEKDPALAPAFEPFAIWLAKTDPEEAVRWAERVPEGARRARALLIACKRWRHEDAEAFEAWFRQSDLPEATRRALTSVSNGAHAAPHRRAGDQEPDE